jgi:signal transduction histidine kinase
VTLRTKVLVIIGIAVASLVAIFYTTSQTVTLSSSDALEDQNTRQNVERAASALDSQILALDGAIDAGARLEDTYNLVQNPERGYIFGSLSQKALGSVALDFLVIVNTSGETVYGMGYDIERQEVTPVPSSLVDHLSADSILVKHPDAENGVAGILLLEEGPIIVGSRPISGSEHTAPIAGAMIGGRFMEETEIQELSALTRLPLSVVEYEGSDLPPDFEVASASLSQEEPVFVKPLGEDSICGYALLSDIYGSPALIMRADMPRDIYQQGQASSRNLAWALMGVGTAFLFLTLVLMEKLILSRMTRLSESVAAIGESGNISARVPVAGRDELSRLGENINGMLGALEKSIQEKEKAEEETVKIEQQLQLAGRLAAVGELAAGVAHELNNPLAAIQAYAQFIASREDLDSTLQKDMETIYRESQRASKITGNLLAFARRDKPEKTLISINEVLQEALELHGYRLKVNNIEVVSDLDPALPKTLADSHQMQQVFVNLMTNAEQAMTQAHGRGTLVLKTRSSDGMIWVSFTDNGPGIPDEDRERLFDPFFTTKDVGQGTGLGLSICYGIVQKHNGRLYAQTVSGGGASLVVEIPIILEDQQATEQTDSAEIEAN